MRYLIALFLLSGCCAAEADEPKPAAPKETYTAAVQRFEASVKGLAETVGNQTAELECVKQEVKTMRDSVDALRKAVDSINVPPSSVAVPTPADPPPPVKVDAPPVESARKVVSRTGLTFQGKPIDAQSWLNRSVAFVDIKGDIDTHLRDHGLEGDFSGFTRHQKLHLHSVAHTYGVPLKSSKVVVNAAIVLPRSSNCPNGNCPLQYGYQQRSRLFGRSWR